MSASQNPTSEFLTPDELASMLKISKTGVYRLIGKRKIRFHKFMGSIRFERSDVLTFLRQSRIELVGPNIYDSKKD